MRPRHRPPWNPAAQACPTPTCTFADEWRRYFRGELPVKDDAQVTDGGHAAKQPDPLRRPRHNSRIAEVLPKLPLQWTSDELRDRRAAYAAADHAPVLIHPSPLADGRYVVLNSGHTFHEPELSA